MGGVLNGERGVACLVMGIVFLVLDKEEDEVVEEFCDL